MTFGVADIEYGVEEMEKQGTQLRVEQAVSEAFVAAYLVTANAREAEDAVVDALDSWEPEDDGEKALVERVLSAVLRDPVKHTTRYLGERSAVSLPAELDAVLGLPTQLRLCFVLRILAGLGRQLTAQMLRLSSHQVDEFTSAALQCLPALERSDAGIARLVWAREMN